MKYKAVLFFSFMFLVSCGQLNEKALVGSWNAVEVTEDGMPARVDISEIRFTFSNDGFYHYYSTLDYQEAGTYYVNNRLLYTLDTLNEASTEKAVSIALMTGDSLVLRMNAEGMDKVMKFIKEK